MSLLKRNVGDAIKPEDENFITSHFQISFGIPNFALLNQPGGIINSCTFDGDLKYGDGWRVQFRNCRQDVAQVALQLVQTDSTEEISTTFRICLLNHLKFIHNDGKVDVGTFVPGREVKGVQEWSVSYLSDPTNGCLKDGSVFFNVQVSTRRLKVEPLSKSESKNTGFASEQLKSFLVNENFTDVVLTRGNSRFPASKIILAAQSPVFFAMFNSEMLESKENVVNIEDFSDETVKGFLEFLYTGKLEGLEENAGELLKISDKYQVMKLKGKCEKILLKNLKIENAMDILVFAHLHSPEKLKPKIISFVNNHFNLLKNTESYGRVKKEYPQIIFDLYEAMHEIK